MSALIPLLLAACSRGSAEAPRCATAERHELSTDDGASLTLHRHRAEGPPVLLVHGISSNHRCWDLEDGRSLASYLADAGLDTWLLDLRGHGDSDRGSGRPDWNMDDYGRRDVPAAVRYVLTQTGAEQVAYVGHSMGGMVAAITLSTEPEIAASLSSVVAVGSPMDFSDPDPLTGAALQLAALSGAVLPVLPSALGADLQATMRRNPLPVDAILYNDIADPEVRAEMYRSVVSPIFGGELEQLGQLRRGGGFRSADGSLDYLEALGGVSVPVMVIAGRADNIAPVDRVLPYYTALGGEKSLVIAGRATGFAADYGHMDLALGDHAQEEIFPLIRAWIERY